MNQTEPVTTLPTLVPISQISPALDLNVLATRAAGRPRAEHLLGLSGDGAHSLVGTRRSPRGRWNENIEGGGVWWTGTDGSRG